MSFADIEYRAPRPASPSKGKPIFLQDWDKMTAGVFNAMSRSKSNFPQSIRAMFKALLSRMGRAVMIGEALSVSVPDLAAWGGCSERQARRNLAGLREHGVVEVLEGGRGGRGVEMRIAIDLTALRELLTRFANASMGLCRSLSGMKNRAIHALRRVGKVLSKPGHKPGHTRPPLYRDTLEPLVRGDRQSPKGRKPGLAETAWSRIVRMPNLRWEGGNV